MMDVILKEIGKSTHGNYDRHHRDWGIKHSAEFIIYKL